LPPLLHAAGDYFVTSTGQTVYLAGSRTWNQAQQIGPAAFTFGEFVNFDKSIGSNFIRYWNFTSSEDGAGPTPDSQLPFMRSSTPGANDGGNKWDLTKFNQVFFDNMRSNVIAAGHQGMYVSIMLFFGETNYPVNWNSDAFNGANNINGVNPGSAYGEQVLGNAAVMAAEKAYVAKIIDTVGDLPNVLFEVSNESVNDGSTFQWQDNIAQFVKAYEAQKGYAPHPIGITAPYPGGDPNVNATTLIPDPNSDWTSPYGWYSYQSSPPDAPGNKPLIVDTDHIGGGLGADWVWQMFTRGYNVAYMDDMGGSGLADPALGNNSGNYGSEISARLGIQETVRAAQQFNLADMLPNDSLSTTGYALANAVKGEFVVFAPQGGQFGVDLSGSSGTLNAQWVNVATGSFTSAGQVQGGGYHSFTAPDSADALLLHH
jgi:hypothetical protein